MFLFVIHFLCTLFAGICFRWDLFLKLMFCICILANGGIQNISQRIGELFELSSDTHEDLTATKFLNCSLIFFKIWSVFLTKFSSEKKNIFGTEENFKFFLENFSSVLAFEEKIIWGGWQHNAPQQGREADFQDIGLMPYGNTVKFEGSLKKHWKSDDHRRRNETLNG